MAQTTTTVLEDDLDGGPADETVSFALDGVSYQIDLSAANAARLRDDLATWVGHGRRSSLRPSAPGRGRPPAAGASSSDVEGEVPSTAVVRAWATENGHPVNARGRVPAPVVEAYRAAHS